MTTHLAGHAIVRHPGQPAATPEGVNGYPPGAALMTAAGLESLRSELGRLRERTGLEVAHRLREARSYGEGANNDEYHAVREEQMAGLARPRATRWVVFERAPVPLSELGGRLVRRLQELEQRRIRVRGGADRLIGQHELT
jgi:hypothetical protein